MGEARVELEEQLLLGAMLRAQGEWFWTTQEKKETEKQLFEKDKVNRPEGRLMGGGFDHTVFYAHMKCSQLTWKQANKKKVKKKEF